jgi:putative colanic acid biosynthesis acetyltransferase WcaB
METENSQFAGIFQDWNSNPHDLRIRCSLAAFRLMQRIGQWPRFARILCFPLFFLYRIIVVWIFHMELFWWMNIGAGLRIYHGYCLVIHPATQIGKNVTLRHCVTLGNKRDTFGAPILEDGVDVGANAIIIGEITIGRNAVIGAGAVVTKDVPAGAVVAGNPAVIIKYIPSA